MLQFATLYEVMVGVTCGFLAPQTIIPTASALVLAGALLAPLLIRTVVRAVMRHLLVKEQGRLVLTLSALKYSFTYRTAPADYDHLHCRLTEVNTRLAQLNA